MREDREAYGAAGDGSERRPSKCRAGRERSDRAGASSISGVGQGAESYAVVEVRCSCHRSCDNCAIKRHGEKVWVPPCGCAANFVGGARSAVGGASIDLQLVGWPGSLQGNLQGVGHRALDSAIRSTVLKLSPRGGI